MIPTSPAAELTQLIDSFSGRKVLLVGDLVADHYIHGKSSRISREAPVIILKYQSESVIPGQAGNTAANIAALGGEARLVGVIGDDRRGNELYDALGEAGIKLDGIVRSADGATLTKTRILAGGRHTAMQQVIRIDDDDRLPGGTAEQDAVIANMKASADWAEAIIVSDYGYGVVTEQTWALAREISTRRSIPLVLDSRYSLTRWTGATLITPNEEEALAAASGLAGPGDICSVGETLRELTQCAHLIITRGNEGMMLFNGHETPRQLPVFGSTECTDVTGAGDTVVATATLALASGADAYTAMVLSNLAGALVVMKLGTATTNQDEMKAKMGLVKLG
jgi:rfaE bifunctional protein kinase chain/domain